MRWRDFDNLTPLPDAFFQTPRRVHFIGIGGIGMSALAFVLRSRGHHVSGSDVSESSLLDKLRAADIAIAIGHRAENLALPGAPAEAIIFGSAISPDNPERAAAQQNIVQWHRAQLLAYFVNNAKYSIAVSGTHGKSTTSAMIAHILTRCGKNPTALLGAEYPPFGSNVRIGDPDLVVAEADESDGSFTLLCPTVAVVTNVEPEHLENYDNKEEELWRAFEMFAKHARTATVLNKGKPLDWQVLASPDVYPKIHASKIRVDKGQTHFDLKCIGKRIGTFALVVPGVHNVSNALAAICAVWPMNVQPADAARALADFRGVARRFEFKGEVNDILVYDDYAHHPTEVQSTLQAAREFLQRPLLVIFQPHRYSRTQQMGHLFGPSFEAADRVIITELYSAFEEPIEGVSGRIVFDAVREQFPEKPVYYAETLHEARQLVSTLAQPGNAIITMGAGDSGTLGPQLLQDLKK